MPLYMVTDFIRFGFCKPMEIGIFRENSHKQSILSVSNLSCYVRSVQQTASANVECMSISKWLNYLWKWVQVKPVMPRTNHLIRRHRNRWHVKCWMDNNFSATDLPIFLVSYQLFHKTKPFWFHALTPLCWVRYSSVFILTAVGIDLS